MRASSWEATSSIARGSRSSRSQTWCTTSRSGGLEPETARARATKSADASSGASAGSQNRCSPLKPSRSRLVTMTWSFGVRSRSRWTSAAASSTCSKQSSTRSVLVPRSAHDTAASGSPDPASHRRQLRPRAEPCAGSPSASSGTQATPSGKRPANRRASSIANRVLPSPPGPTIVVSRAPRSVRTAAASSRSCSRPTNDDGGNGSEIVVSSGGRSSSVGSCSSIRRWSSRIAEPGSSPYACCNCPRASR